MIRYWSKRFAWAVVVVLLLLLGSNGRIQAQHVDELTPATDSLPSIGATGIYDFLAQSFVAEVGRVSKVGVWLKADNPAGNVQLTIFGNSGRGTPDLNYVVFQSALVAPDSIGGWVYDTITGAALSPGDTFWVAIDGYANPGASGHSSVGVSSSATSTGTNMLGSIDGGQNWVNTINNAMAIYVEGDTCSIVFDLQTTFPAVCSGAPTTITAPSSFSSYIWSTGATGSTLTVTTGGIYTVTLTDNSLCMGSAFIFLANGTNPNPDLDDLYVSCEYDSALIQAYPHFDSYFWSTGGTGTYVLVDSSGSYSVTVVDFDGCIGRDTATVIMTPAPQVDLGTDTTLCTGSLITLDGGAGMAGYFWSGGDVTRSITVGNPGVFWVELTDSLGCVGMSDTVRVDFVPVPDKPTISFSLEGIQSSFGFSYQWMRDGQLIDVVERAVIAPEPGYYQVIITNGYGCEAVSDSFRVEATDMGSFISEGFSPNGDGLNEVFFVEGIENYPDSKLTVMNRWGDVVHEVTGYQNDWRGTGPGGKPLPDANYFYVIQLGDGLTARKGAVVINR